MSDDNNSKNDPFRIEIKTKIDMILNTQNDMREKIAYQNGRVGKLEKFQYFLSGSFLIISILIAPIIVRVISSIFQINLGV